MGRETRVAARVIGIGLAVGLAGGCSTMSDALDPGSWFEGRERPAAQPRAVSERVPGEDRPFPNLSTVPPRPQPTSPEARRQIAQGLSADRDNARYSDEVIRRQSDAGVPPPRPVARAEAPSVAPGAQPPATTPPQAAAPPVTARTPDPPPVAAVPSPAAAAPPSALPAARAWATPASRPPSRPIRPSDLEPGTALGPIVEGIEDEPLPALPPEPVSRDRDLPPPARAPEPAPVPRPTPLEPAPSAVDRAAPERLAQVPPSAVPPPSPGVVPPAPPPEPVVPAAPRATTAPSPILPSVPPREGSATGRERDERGPLRRRDGAMPPNTAPPPSAVPPAPSAPSPILPSVPGRGDFGRGPSAEAPANGAAPGALALLTEGNRAATGGDAAGLRLATIAFAGGSARLDDDDRRAIRQVATIQRRQGGIVRIVGHASQENANAASARERVASLGVSLERANAVAAELVRAGVARSAVRIEARGDTEPVVPGTSREADRANRRVEIFIDF